MNCPFCTQTALESFFQGTHGAYYNCLNCDLIYLDSKCYLSIEDEKKRYDSHENFITDEKYRSYLISTFKYLENFLEPNPILLDFGSGPTEGMKFVLNEIGYNCDSYDPIYYPQLNLKNSFYDGIILSESVEHFYHPRKEFDLILSMLKKTGKILIRTERHLGMEHFKTWYYHKDPTHVVFFSMKTFEYISKKYNLHLSFPAKNIVLFRREIEA